MCAQILTDGFYAGLLHKNRRLKCKKRRRCAEHYCVTFLFLFVF